MKNTVQVCSLCVGVLIVIASVMAPGEKPVAAGTANRPHQPTFTPERWACR